MKKFSHSIKIISRSKLLNCHHHNNHNNRWINRYNFYSTYVSSKTASLEKSGDVKNVIYDFRSDTGIYINLYKY